MKKRLLGYVVMIVLLVATISTPFMNANAAGVNGANKNTKVELTGKKINIVKDTAKGKALSVGDTYTVQIAISDKDMETPTSARIMEYYINFNIGDVYNHNDDVELWDAAISHDEVNHNYIFTMERTIDSQVNTGNYFTYGLELKYNDNKFSELMLDPDEFEMNRHYVVSDEVVPRVVVSKCQQVLAGDETFQAKALLLPEVSEVPATWTSDDDTVASVDENGMITGLKKGVTWIRANNDGMIGGIYIVVTSDSTKKVEPKQPEEETPAVTDPTAQETPAVTDAGKTTDDTQATQASTEAETKTNNETPQTGDSMPIVYAVIMMLASGLVMIRISQKKVRKNQ